MALTLTHFEVEGHRFESRDSAERGRAWLKSIPTDARVIDVQTTYTVGQQVEVSAFGRWRPGTITKLGRTKVTVQYQRNQQGTLATRAFGAIEVRPH